MVDQSDVEVALQSIVANALYPNGTNEQSIIGNTCRIYRGLPTAPALDADLVAGVIQISIMATNNVKNTTRYPRIWQIIKPVPASLNVNIVATKAIFSGSCLLGQLAGLIVDEAVYAYAVQAFDSPGTVASNLAALIRSSGIIVDYAESTLNVPTAKKFKARVVNGSGALLEIRRQEQEFETSLWCPDPASRDNATPLIDQAIGQQNFFGLSDGSYARVIYKGSDISDINSDANLFKRCLRYLIEYPTTIAQTEIAMLFGSTSYSADTVIDEKINI